MKLFWEKHSNYFSTIYSVFFYLGCIYGYILVLKDIFDSLRTGNFLGFLLIIVFNTVIAMWNGILTSAFYGTIASIVLFIPYLAIRGFRN